MHSVNVLECNVKQIANAQGRYEFSESELAEFVRQETVSVLEQVFSQWDQQWQHWPKVTATINELTIDLPQPINRRQPERFQQQLLTALRAGILNALPDSLQQQYRFSELLTHFESSLRYRQADYARRDWQFIAELYTQLSSTHRAPIQACLLRLIQSVQIRAFIADQFSDIQLGMLLEVLSPDQAKFILSVIQHSDQFAIEENKSPTNEAPSSHQGPNPAVTKQQITEFSLAFISVQRGSRFNRTRYLRHVLQGIAAHYNTSFDELCEMLHRAAEQAPQNRPWRQELLEITQPEDATPPPANRVNTSAQALVSIEKILTALQQNQTIDSTTWLDFFQLTDHDRSALTLLLRQVLVRRSWRRSFRKTLPSSLRPRVITHLEWLLPEVSREDGHRSFKDALRLFSFAAQSHWGENGTRAGTSQPNSGQ